MIKLSCSSVCLIGKSLEEALPIHAEIGYTLMRLTLAREQAEQAATALLETVQSGRDIELAAADLEAVYYPPEEVEASPGPAVEGEEEEPEVEEEPRDPLMPRYKDSVPGSASTRRSSRSCSASTWRAPWSRTGSRWATGGTSWCSPTG